MFNYIMSYSVRVKSDYANISYKQLKTLLAIVNTANDKTIERIGTLYQQKGQRFKTTLDFAKGIKMLKVRNGKVSRGSRINNALNGSSLIDERLKAALVDLVLNPKNSFYKETHNYLEIIGKKMKVETGMVISEASPGNDHPDTHVVITMPFS